jgi:hypothetical protein
MGHMSVERQSAGAVGLSPGVRPHTPPPTGTELVHAIPGLSTDPDRPPPNRRGHHNVLLLPKFSSERNFSMRAKRLTLQQRRDIFSALVTAQDLGTLTVSESRKQVIDQFEITDAQLRQIEEEGLDKEWPPLNEEVVRQAV